MDLKRYVFIVLKPDTLSKYLDNTAIAGFEQVGLEIVHRKITKMSKTVASTLYKEKEGYNYFNQLVNFMCESQSMMLLARGPEGENATQLAKTYRDWARNNLRTSRFILTQEDTRLLNEGQHEKQAEITQKMALENLIHVSDRLESSLSVFSTMLNSWELSEIRRLDPELYTTIQQFRETNLESTIRQEGNSLTNPSKKELW